MADLIVGALEALERFAAALDIGTGPVPWALVVGLPFPLLAAGAVALQRWIAGAALRGEPLGHFTDRRAGSWFPPRGGGTYSGVPVDPDEPARAAVTAIVLGVLGLVLALASALPRGAAAAYLGYLATLILVAAWAVIRFGIRDPDVQWRRLAFVGWARWYGSFLLVALLTGAVAGLVF